MNRYFFQAAYLGDRTTGISSAEACIGQNGGAILDFRIFSDLAISLIIELPEVKVNDLYRELNRIMVLNDFELLHQPSEKECLIFMNLTFSKGSGRLTTEIPDVPG